MFTGGKHKFTGDEYMFKVGEHKFTVHKYKKKVRSKKIRNKRFVLLLKTIIKY